MDLRWSYVRPGEHHSVCWRVSGMSLGQRDIRWRPSRSQEWPSHQQCRSTIIRYGHLGGYCPSYFRDRALRTPLFNSSRVHLIISMTVTQLHLTPKESERLRVISYHKQRAAGLADAGSAGITSDLWGDGLKWNPPRKVTDWACIYLHLSRGVKQ